MDENNINNNDNTSIINNETNTIDNNTIINNNEVNVIDNNSNNMNDQINIVDNININESKNTDNNDIEVIDFDNNTTVSMKSYVKKLKNGKKLYYFFLILLVALLAFTIYKKSIKKETGYKIENQNDVVKKVEKIDAGDFTLDTNGSFNQLKYKFDKSLEIISMDGALNIVYGLTDNPTFSIKFDYYINKGTNDVINEYFKGQNVSEVTFNGVKWLNINDKERIYISTYKENTYIVRFVSEADLSELVNLFMSNISFSD